MILLWLVPQSSKLLRHVNEMVFYPILKTGFFGGPFEVYFIWFLFAERVLSSDCKSQCHIDCSKNLAAYSSMHPKFFREQKFFNLNKGSYIFFSDVFWIVAPSFSIKLATIMVLGKICLTFNLEICTDFIGVFYISIGNL